MMMMMAQEKRAGKQKYSYSPSKLVPPPLHLLRPPVVVCLMSEKIYKIEIENKLTTLFVAHAEREGGSRDSGAEGGMLRHY